MRGKGVRWGSLRGDVVRGTKEGKGNDKRNVPLRSV